MDAQSEAKQLLTKFDLFSTMDVNVNKECALICINEKIKYHESLFNKGFKDVHIALSSPIKTYNEILNPSLEHLENIKKELMKL
jgi:hypothetical protein